MGGSGSKIEKPADIKTVWFDEYVKSNLLPTTEDVTNRFSGKTIAITGCTSGTGYVLAETCVKNGAENVLLLNRPSERAETAKSKLEEIRIQSSSSTVIDGIACDLQDFASVKQAIDTIRSKYEAIDVLCNNGGVMALEDVATKDGYDVQMQTNHLSHFLLTKELFPLLKRAVELRGEARVVNHSSVARFGSPLKDEYLGKNGGSLGGNSASMIFNGARWERYHQTKLANAVFTLELSNRIKNASSESTKGIKSVVAAPGLAATNLQVTTSGTGGMNAFTYRFISTLAQSAEDGTLPLFAACFDKTTENGDFWEPSNMTRLYGPPIKVAIDKHSLKDEQRSLLWTKSEEACGEFKVE